MKYELVIFDWDGTLVDSLGRIVTCMQGAAQAVGEMARTDDQVKDIIGLELNEAIRVLYPEMPPTRVNELRDHYSRLYIENEREPSRFFDGVPELLQALRSGSHLLGVATGKSRRGLERAMASLTAKEHFHATRCADETRGKPHPDMVIELLDMLKVKPDRAVVVGDSELDLEMASRAGVASIGVGWGAHDIKRLAQFSDATCVGTVDALVKQLGL